MIDDTSRVLCNPRAKPTFKPLTDLKFAYRSRSSDATSKQAEISTKLPLIETSDRPKNRNTFHTRIREYTDIVNKILKTKIELAQLYDEISRIDSKMNENETRYREARTKHENFAQSFERFVASQYELVRDTLKELNKNECVSRSLRSMLNQLQQEQSTNSLKIYELENIWRSYKRSQSFVTYISPLMLLRNQGVGNTNEMRALREFKITETPTLDELISNFEEEETGEISIFNRDHFEYVTATRVFDFLLELKRQNFSILRRVLFSQRINNALEDTSRLLGDVFETRAQKVANDVEKIRDSRREIVRDVSTVRESIENTPETNNSISDINSLNVFIENVYERYFEFLDYVPNSHLHMLKCIELYCLQLLYELNSFELNITEKVTVTR